ncbi:MAG: hypothetical protein LC662_07065 [Rhodothermaceae bacterium]|nr:hypothetical protein [Rhodothermaceae bacterium]
MNCKHISAAIILAAIILQGCGIPSVHPLYEPGDLITHDQLNGTWVKSGENSVTYEVMNIRELHQVLLDGPEAMNLRTRINTQLLDVKTASEVADYLAELIDTGRGNLYVIQKRENPEDIYFAGLVQLGENHYLDLYKLDFDMPVFSYPVHIFMKVSIAEEELRVHMFSQEWLTDLIKNRQVRIRHEINDMDSILLTAAPGDLQKFIIKYGDVEQAYANDETYIRINDKPEFSFEDDSDG